MKSTFLSSIFPKMPTQLIKESSTVKFTQHNTQPVKHLHFGTFSISQDMFSLVKSRWIRYPLVANTPLKIKFPSKWLTGDAMLRLILVRTFNNVRSRCACTHGCSPRERHRRTKQLTAFRDFFFFYTGAGLWMAQIASGHNIRFSGRQLVLSEVARSID